MTLNELNQHLKLIETRENQQEMLDSLHESIGPKARTFTGMPRGTEISDPTAAITAAIEELEKDIQCMDVRIQQSQLEIEKFLQTLDDAKLRALLRLRFISGMQWKEVAATSGKYATQNSVKGYCYRCLRKLEEDALVLLPCK